MSREAVRPWVRQAETDQGQRGGLTTSERERLKEFEKDNEELRRADEILKAAAAFFGAELDRQLPPPGRRSLPLPPAGRSAHQGARGGPGGGFWGVCATAVSAEGHREILGLDLFTAEGGAAWTCFLRDLVARGLSGVRLCVLEDHRGLVGAVQAVLPGTSWQRCRTHFMKNIPCGVARSAQSFVATSRSIPGEDDELSRR